MPDEKNSFLMPDEKNSFLIDKAGCLVYKEGKTLKRIWAA